MYLLDPETLKELTFYQKHEYNIKAQFQFSVTTPTCARQQSFNIIILLKKKTCVSVSRISWIPTTLQRGVPISTMDYGNGC